MTDGPDLLGRILAEPGEDLHRLQYADWLEENAGTVPCGACAGDGRHRHKTVLGNGLTVETATAVGCRTCGGSGTVPDGRAARAEFIRVGCELARLSASQTCRECCPVSSRIARKCRGCDLRRRERELLIAHEESWSPQTTRFFTVETVAGANNPVVWRRGFVESLTCTAADWLAHERALYWTPPVQCPKCHGSRVEVDWRQRRPVKGPCPECLGEGTIPTLTDPCPGCGRTAIRGEVLTHDPPTPGRPDGSWSPKKCPRCRGKGTVPRPMPPTACPIREVTWLSLSADDVDRLVRRWLREKQPDPVDRALPEIAADLWPGITFRLFTAAPG